jgi:hypothetical protein
MITVADVVRPLLNAHGETHWRIGVVLALTARRTITVRFIGATTAGAGTPGVGYLAHYVPKVNDIVHVLIAETGGAIAIGSTGVAPPGWNDPPPPPPPPVQVPPSPTRRAPGR